ncbi:MAG: TatD family hydrolase [Planctomycetota bacterium]
MKLIDIAANLTSSQFNADREQVIARAIDAGVDRLLVLGTSLRDSEGALELARRYPGTVWATAGVHPHDAKHWSADAAKRIDELLREPEVLCVGECGLDLERNFSPPDDQHRAYREQVELAIEHRLPLYLHERGSADELLAVLEPRRSELRAVVVHCFTGEGPTLDRYLALDLHIGITGWICDERRGFHLHPLVARIPHDRLMVETDAPYLLPRTLRPKPKGRRNEPSYLPAVIEQIATCTGETPQAVAARTTATAERFLGLPAID